MTQALKRLPVYLGLLSGFVCLFFFLHYQANKLPVELAVQRIDRGFDSGFVIRDDYPFRSFGTQSARSLIGQDQYSECQSLQTMLHPSDQTLRDAVVLMKHTIPGIRHCAAVFQMVKEGAEPVAEQVRTRYWWGWVALYSIALNKLDIFQVIEGIRGLTYFTLTLLAVAAYRFSRKMFFLMSPLLVHSCLFGGIIYYGGVTFSLSFLWSLVALSLLLFYLAGRTSLGPVNLVFFCFGVFSSFLFSMDGHLMLLLPYAMAILYLALEKQGDTTFSRKMAICVNALLLFAAGFSGSFFLNQIAKSYYLGFEAVYENFSSGLTARLSDVALGKSVDPVNTIKNLFRQGFRVVGAYRINGLYDFLVTGALFAMAIAYAFSAVTCIKRETWQPLMTLLFLTSSMSMVFVRILLLLNHSSIHTEFIGRYMFVPLSMCWMMLIYALQCRAEGVPSDRSVSGV